jgi:hypothetical protein
MESSNPGDNPGSFEPIQGHNTSFGRFDKCIKRDLPTFDSGDVVGRGVDRENSVVTATISWSWRSVSFILARPLT